MYYQLLNKKIFPENYYNIYLDIKDTHSYKKAKSLKTIMTSSSIIPDNSITTELVTAAFATIHKPTIQKQQKTK